MKLAFRLLLPLALVLGACTPNSAPAQPESVLSASATSEPAAHATEADTTAPAENRNAIIEQTEGNVIARVTSESEPEPAGNGLVIEQGGGLQTGPDGRVRLDLMPEKTILRIAPNSAFVLSNVGKSEDGTPTTSLSLFFGKIFILLNGGSVDVETPSGVASVRGSVMSISYNPGTGQIQAACIEGHCTLENENGEEVDIPEGDSGSIDEDGNINQFDSIDQDEIIDWVENIPELEDFLDEIPDPNEYENLDEYEEYNFDPNSYFEENTEGDGGEFWFFDDEYFQEWDWNNLETDGGESPTEESTTEDPATDQTSDDGTYEDTSSGDEEAPTEEPNP